MKTKDLTEQKLSLSFFLFSFGFKCFLSPIANVLKTILSYKTYFFRKFERNSPKRQTTKKSFLAISRTSEALLNKTLKQRKETIIYRVMKVIAGLFSSRRNEYNKEKKMKEKSEEIKHDD